MFKTQVCVRMIISYNTIYSKALKQSYVIAYTFSYYHFRSLLIADFLVL